MKFNKLAWDKYIAEKNPLLVSSFKSFQHSLDHFKKRDNEDDRRFCVVEIDQALELFFKGILLERGKNPYHMRFPRLLKEVENILELSEKEITLISKLHEKRDACQHEGEIPGTNQTEHLIHSAFRFLLDKAEKTLGITPNQMTDKIPGLLLMDVKEASVGKLPEKPEILQHLEAAAETLLVLGDFDLAFTQIALVAAKTVDILYEYEDGPPLGGVFIKPPHRRVSDFDPRDLIKRELNLMKLHLDVQFEKLKLEASKVPFDMTIPIQLIPMVAYAIKKLSYLTKEGILQPNTSERILSILRIDLLKSMQPQFPRKTQRLVDRYLKTVLTFDFLIKEFLFLRQFIASTDIIFNALEKYYEEHAHALRNALQ